MKIAIIENPSESDVAPIINGVVEYGLLEVHGVMPRKWGFHAKECDKLIGGATGKDHFSQFYLDNIWVKEEYRKKGVGTTIHEKVFACAQECGCKRVQLNTLNQKAVMFYKKLGYEILAEVEDYIDGFNLYYMAKTI